MTSEEYLQLINADPKDVKTSEDGSYRFIPISSIEENLDVVYRGMWSWELDRETFGKNFAIGKGTLRLVHPVSGDVIRKGGTAAIDISKDISMDYPKLEAACILNAAKKIGPAFGRNLNRDRDDAEIPTIQIDKEDGLEDAQFIAVKNTLASINEYDKAVLFLSKSAFRFHPELKKIVESKKPNE